ncbi:OmpA family protein [Spartinivicinus ruber]|uniref:OmpA family protein n=1 Tax=Spartinivicinus ruber TaxID=2683272 RepID=UPI0013D41C7D|nr:OmpA family protein [Spartinivicinus ruber]
MKKMNLITTGIVLSLATYTVAAEEQVKPHAYVAPSVGKYFFNDDRGLEDDSIYSLDFGYQFNERTALQLGVGGLKTEDPGLDNEVDAQWYHLDGLYFFNPKGKWKPYLLASAAHMRIDPNTSGVDEETLLGVGVGIERELTDRLALRTDVRGYHSLDEDDNDAAWMFSLKYALGDTKTSKPRKVTPAPTPVEEPQTIYVDKPVSVRLNVEFDFDKSEVKPEYYGELEKAAQFLRKYSNVHVTIEGHTDSVGNDTYNLMLSQSRADAVREALIEQYQVDGNRLTAIGKGEAEPIADNGTPLGRKQNRRVVATIEAVDRVEKVVTE